MGFCSRDICQRYGISGRNFPNYNKIKMLFILGRNSVYSSFKTAFEAQDHKWTITSLGLFSHC